MSTDDDFVASLKHAAQVRAAFSARAQQQSALNIQWAYRQGYGGTQCASTPQLQQSQPNPLLLLCEEDV